MLKIKEAGKNFKNKLVIVNSIFYGQSDYVRNEAIVIVVWEIRKLSFFKNENATANFDYAF